LCCDAWAVAKAEAEVPKEKVNYKQIISMDLQMDIPSMQQGR
jgi:hypothetical protein